jgi:hypothetical protein
VQVFADVSVYFKYCVHPDAQELPGNLHKVIPPTIVGMPPASVHAGKATRLLRHFLSPLPYASTQISAFWAAVPTFVCSDAPVLIGAAMFPLGAFNEGSTQARENWMEIPTIVPSTRTASQRVSLMYVFFSFFLFFFIK